MQRLRKLLTEELTEERRKELKKEPEEKLTEEELRTVKDEVARFQKRVEQGFRKITSDFSSWEFVSHTPTALYIVALA